VTQAPGEWAGPAPPFPLFEQRIAPVISLTIRRMCGGAPLRTLGRIHVDTPLARLRYSLREALVRRLLFLEA
jgi:hypothetical protein